MRKIAMTGAESFWYVLGCIGFGASYFAKVSASPAISDLPQFREAREALTTPARHAVTPELKSPPELLS